MRRVGVVVVFSCLSPFSLAVAGPGTEKLSVVFKQVLPRQGVVRVALYDGRESFLSKHWVQAQSQAATAAQLRFEFKNLEPGTYAVSAYQDLNENKKLDQNFLGIPKEPYGFSNNVRGALGPPSFRETSVTLPQSEPFEIHLK